MIFYIITTALIIPTAIYGVKLAESYETFSLGSFMVLVAVIFFVINFIVPISVHTVNETSTINKHTELSYHYSLCNEKQNINCASIIKDVYQFNSDLKDYKHYNEIFDMYYSDEVASLNLIK